MTTPFATLRQGVTRNLGTWLQFSTTTLITGLDAYIISTSLAQFGDDYFNNKWWVLITSGNNIGVKRLVKDYTAGSYRLEVYGANLLAETVQVTCELHKYDPDDIKAAINKARLYPGLHVPLVDETLLGNNALPNAHFEDWAVATYPDYWRMSVVTGAKETTIIRGGKASFKITRAGVDGYGYISQAEWPRLLDLQGETVTFSTWLLASLANQAYIEIYTKKADGTTQTKTSAAHTGGGESELIEIEDFTLNDDLTDIQFRVVIKNSDGSVYFDNCRVNGIPVYDYLLPSTVKSLYQVEVQASGDCDDLGMSAPSTKRYDWSVLKEADKRLLHFEKAVSDKLKIHLIATGYLSLLSADTDTVEIDAPYTDKLELYAAAFIATNLGSIMSTQEAGRYKALAAELFARARAAPSMMQPAAILDLSRVMV